MYRHTVDGFFTNPSIWRFDNTIYYTRENWLAYIASQDDSPLPTVPGYEEFIKAINEGFDRNSVDGLLRCDRLTIVYSEKVDNISF